MIETREKHPKKRMPPYETVFSKPNAKNHKLLEKIYKQKTKCML